MKRGIAPFHIDRKEYHLTMDRIPAWVCSQCGEAYFDEAEVEPIQETLKSFGPTVRKNDCIWLNIEGKTGTSIRS